MVDDPARLTSLTAICFDAPSRRANFDLATPSAVETPPRAVTSLTKLVGAVDASLSRRAKDNSVASYSRVETSRRANDEAAPVTEILPSAKTSAKSLARGLDASLWRRANDESVASCSRVACSRRANDDFPFLEVSTALTTTIMVTQDARNS
jgi:hypothetical protein